VTSLSALLRRLSRRACSIVTMDSESSGWEMIEPDSRRYGGALALSGVVKAEKFVTISAQYLNDIAQLCRAIAKRFAYDLYKFV
jgi:hypothetical protein